MSGKEIAAKLRQALALMNNSGAHWAQGASRRETIEGVEYCSIGAIRKVVYGDPYGDMGGDRSAEYPLTLAVANAIGAGAVAACGLREDAGLGRGQDQRVPERRERRPPGRVR